MAVRHFLSLLDLSAAEFRALIKRAIELREERRHGLSHDILRHQVLGMIFEKSSTRTRVAFEGAMLQCGGSAIFLSPRDTQLGRGEPIQDTARVLSRMVDIITIRTYEHSKLELFAAHSRVPVINALTDREHPCQLLADMQTYFEQRGDIRGKSVAWLGDGNNMCHSYIHAAQLLDFDLRIACPAGYVPDTEIVRAAGARVSVNDDPFAAARGADLLVTDVWASMGQEEEEQARRHAFAPYQVTAAVMAEAKADALFMHCLPAHRGEEVSDEVLEGPQSVVWDEAENRLHSQKALLELLLRA
ncbi:MAG: ornithine carbamoyltransferase [Pseudomonadota bacterium]